MLRRSVGVLRRSSAGWGGSSTAWRTHTPVMNRSLSQLGSSTSKPDAAVLRSGVLASLRQERDFAKHASDEPPVTPRTKVPKYVPGVIGKYASSLYITAARAGALDQIESEMRELVKAVSQSSNFKNFANNIFMEKRERVKIIKDVFDKSNLHKFTKSFMVILAEDGKLRDFLKIANTFLDIMYAHRGFVKAVITTADELSDKEMDYVKSKIVSQLLEPGQTPVVEQKIDEDIIGGVIVEAGDKVLDMSIAKRIQRIEKILMESL